MPLNKKFQLAEQHHKSCQEKVSAASTHLESLKQQVLAAEKVRQERKEEESTAAKCKKEVFSLLCQKEAAPTSTQAPVLPDKLDGLARALSIDPDVVAKRAQ